MANGKLSNEQIERAIAQCRERVKSVQAAITAGYAKLFANHLADLEYQIRREQKQIKKYECILKRRTQG